MVLLGERGRGKERSLTIRIFHGRDVGVVVQVVQERREYPPAGVQLVVTDEVGVVAL